MNESTLIICLVNVLTILVGIFVAPRVAYGKRKGAISAENENYRTLLEQVKETTEAQKRIEAAISDDVWDRQKQWEMKRDAVLKALDAVNEIYFSLGDFDRDSVHLGADDPVDAVEMLAQQKKAGDAIWAKLIRLSSSILEVNVTVGGRLSKDLPNWRDLVITVAKKIMESNAPHVHETNEREEIKAKMGEIKAGALDILKGAREALGIKDAGCLPLPNGSI